MGIAAEWKDIEKATVIEEDKVERMREWEWRKNGRKKCAVERKKR